MTWRRAAHPLLGGCGSADASLVLAVLLCLAQRALSVEISYSNETRVMPCACCSGRKKSPSSPGVA